MINWDAVIRELTTFAGGVLVAFLSLRGKQGASKASTESVYAHSMPEMIAKVQELLEQLESKNGTIAELKAQVEAQSATIDILTNQVGELRQQLNIFIGGKTHEDTVG